MDSHLAGTVMLMLQSGNVLQPNRETGNLIFALD